MLNKTFDDDVDNDGKEDRIQIVRSALGKLAPHGQQASSKSQQEKTTVESMVANHVCTAAEDGKDRLSSRKMASAVGPASSKEAKSIFQLKIHENQSLPESIRGPPYDYELSLIGQEEDNDDIGVILKLLQ